MHKKIYTFLLVSILLVVAVSCSSRKPIKIGVAVELSGSRGTIGLAIRNGAEMAADQINAEGGINGRPIELLVRDDLGDPETARQVDAELIEEGVAAIIGHVTSQQTKSVLDLINEAKVVLISPTTSSPEFSGQDDYFFRVMQGNEGFGEALAQYIYDQGIRELACIYDASNEAFAATYWEAAKDKFSALGGEILPAITFYSAEKPDLNAVITELAAEKPEAVLIIASGVDTALLAQYANLQGLDARLYGSSWAVTDELLQKGGAAIEGMVLNGLTNPQDSSEAYLSFQSQYVDRYGVEPGLGASHAYEAVIVLAEALRKTNGSTDGLREALTSISDFQGVNGKISIDQYGDVNREFYLVMVENGKFVTIASISQESLEQ